MNLVSRLLSKNLSLAQTAAFTVANFVGLAIVVGGIQIYEDVKGIWQDEDSFVRKDYMVINKHITSANTFGSEDASFAEEEIADLESQPWVRKVGRFQACDFRVDAVIGGDAGGLSTMMFFESIPSEYIDVADEEWTYTPGEKTVPVIMSKDYLTLYNFGFASSAGLPQVSERMFSSIPITMRLRSDDYSRGTTVQARVVGFSNRLNTILVPEEFMTWGNEQFGTADHKTAPSRLIVDVSSPGDSAIQPYLDSREWEVAGDKSNSRASFLVNVIAFTVVAVGIVITVLSFFVLLLSVSLLMTKNRSKLHALIMLGYPYGTVAAPYRRLVVWVCIIAYVLAIGAMFALRATYIGPISQMNEQPVNHWMAPAVGAAITVLVIIFNIIAVNRRVKSARYA